MSGPRASEFAIVGAGPGGLTAALVAAQRGAPAFVLEAGDQVGGIAKTVERGGYRFDLGGHRFFTKLAPVQRLWEETLGDELLLRPRLSRIYYRGEFFAYPLRAEDVVRRLGLAETLRCTGSYAASRARPARPGMTFESWVTARFGRRLYDVFFREYTEKVWGIAGSEIEAEWAAQRIRNLSFWTALAGALRLRRTHVTSLIEEFHYPRLGPGQMWEAIANRVQVAGVPIELGRRCVRLRHRSGHVHSIVTATQSGAESEEAVAGVLSSMPLSDLVLSLDPAPPPDVQEAARRLRYRDLIVVGIVASGPEPFPDNWIYLHDPGVRAGRVQNFGAWSAGMTHPGFTSLGAEYFCFEGDDLWLRDDRDLVALATTELAEAGLLDPGRVVDGHAIRVPRAYPMYDRGYRDAVTTLRRHVAGLQNLQTFGRNGLHRYNNQDHSMLTGALAARNLLDGELHDLWSVNVEEAYIEEGDLLEVEFLGEALREAAA